MKTHQTHHTKPYTPHKSNARVETMKGPALPTQTTGLQLSHQTPCKQLLPVRTISTFVGQKKQAGESARTGTTELAPIDTNAGCRLVGLTLLKSQTTGPTCTPHKQEKNQQIAVHLAHHTKSVDNNEDRSGGKGRAAQISPSCRPEQKNSTISENSKVSPTSCSSYVELGARETHSEVQTRELFEQNKNFESPQGQESLPSFKICSTTPTPDSNTVRNGSKSKKVDVLHQSQIDSSAYSIKPFNQVNQKKPCTPEQVSSTFAQSLENDSKLNFQSGGKVNRRSAFTWKASQVVDTMSQHAQQVEEKLVQGANLGESTATILMQRQNLFHNVPAVAVDSELATKQNSKPASAKADSKVQLVNRTCTADNIREAFSAFSQLIGSPSSQQQNVANDQDSGELLRLDQNAAQIKLGFSFLLKPDFVDLLQALQSTNEHASSDKSFDLPQYDKSIDYSKLAIESQSHLFQLRNEVDQAGLKYLTPQNQVASPNTASALTLKRLHHQSSLGEAASVHNEGAVEEQSEDVSSSTLNKRCLKLLSKIQPFQSSKCADQNMPPSLITNTITSQQKADMILQGSGKPSLVNAVSMVSINNAAAQQNQAERIAGKNGPRKQRTVRRVATLIQKDFKCFFCLKVYGSEAAAIMHMRNKHKAGTKQDIERGTGISVREGLLFADDTAKEWLQTKLCNSPGPGQGSPLAQNAPGAGRPQH